MPRVVRIPLLAAAAVLVAGCPPDFSPYWKVDKLRVLAIQADPVVVPGGEPATLSALVSAPDGQPVDYDWSWCPLPTSAEDEYECPLDADDLDEFGAGDDEELPEDPFDLGDDSEAVFFNFFGEEDVRQFCEQLQQEIIEEFDDEEMVELLPGGDCEEGFEISARLEVSTDDDSVVASKRFRLSAGADEENENPRFVDLQVRPLDEEDIDVLADEVGWGVDAGADHDEQWVSVATHEDDERLEVVEGIPLEVRALVDPDSVLSYTRSGDDEPSEEALDYRWFTTAGTFESSTGVYVPDSNSLEDASNTGLSLSPSVLDEDCSAAHDYCDIDLWSIVRDSRLGTDWIAGRIRVQRQGGRQ